MRIRTLLLSALFVLLAGGALFPMSAEAATLARPANNLGLQAYWSFDEGTSTRAVDSSGNRNTGTLTGGTWVSGKRGKALSFNGTSDKVTGASMTVGTTMTVSAWIKKTSSTGQKSFFSNRGTGGGVYIGLDNTQIFFYDSASVPASAKSSAGSVTIGSWQHVVVTNDGTTTTMYVNGAQVYQLAQTHSASTGSVGIGWDPSLATEFWDGSIDDVRVYSRALSATEVAGLYLKGESMQKTASRTGLVGEWRFNEGTSTNAVDTSGFFNVGTLSGTTIPVWVIGKYGKALNFDGSSSYVTGAGTNLPNVGASANVTVSAWIKPTSVSGTKAILSKGASASCFNYGLALNNGTLRARNTNNDFLVSSSTIAVNVWTQVTIVFTSAGATGYVNGVLDGSNASGATTNCTFTNWTIGTRAYNALSEFFPGSIDDVRVYSRALSSSEIMRLYNVRAVAVNTSQNNKLTNGLVGLWSFDGADLTDKVYDRSGQGNNGYIIGAATSTSKTIGKIGQALKLNGSSSYVAVQNSSSLNPSNLTVSLWAKSNTSTWNNFGFLVSKRSVYIIHPTLGSTSVVFYIYTSGWQSVACTPTTPITSWNLYSLTWNGTNLTAYINGAQCSTASLAGPINTIDTNPLYLGFDTGSRYFGGAEDDVRIYSRALNAAEIKQLYLMGK